MSVNIKTPDGLVRIAGNGGTSVEVDDSLSGTSENPVQNRIITERINELDELIEQTRALKTDLENYGMVKLSNSSTVTENVGLALPASEKNPNIIGSLAYGIKNNSRPLRSYTLQSDTTYRLHIQDGSYQGYHAYLIFGAAFGAGYRGFCFVSNIIGGGCRVDNLIQTGGGVTATMDGNDMLITHSFYKDAILIQGNNAPIIVQPV